MADIFISYASLDRSLAIKLSIFLEAEGWTVWLDQKLSAEGAHRDEIMRQLTTARAVVVIWTHTSIHSDRVRAEAGRAMAEGKLIAVKSRELDGGDLPAPFGKTQTEDLDSTAQIRAAISTQLSKRRYLGSRFWVAARSLPRKLLMGVGIVGGAITLFSNLKGAIGLSDWATWLASHWEQWSLAAWTALLGWIGVDIDPSFFPYLSLVLFSFLVIVGTVLRGGRSPHRYIKSLLWACAAFAICMILLVILNMLSLDEVARYLIPPR